MPNVHDHLQGRYVTITTATTMRRHAVDFPGWGSDDAHKFLLPIEVGMRGVITNVESHGNNPWTRFSIQFTDGTRAYGVDPAICTITPMKNTTEGQAR